MFIYCITNIITKDFYIGKTKHSILRRLRNHIGSVRRGSLSHLHCAIRKYGEENFIIENIESVLPEQDISEREIYWIAVLNPHYNMTRGGEGTFGRKLSSESRKKLSKSLKEAHKNNPTLRKILSEKTKLWWDSNPEAKQILAKKTSEQMKGNTHALGKIGRYKHTDEAKQQISNVHRGKKISEETRNKIKQNRIGKGCGERNAMKRPECVKKISEIAKNRRKFVKPDGSWMRITIDEYQKLNQSKV